MYYLIKILSYLPCPNHMVKLVSSTYRICHADEIKRSLIDTGVWHYYNFSYDGCYDIAKILFSDPSREMVEIFAAGDGVVRGTSYAEEVEWLLAHLKGSHYFMDVK